MSDFEFVKPKKGTVSKEEVAEDKSDTPEKEDEKLDEEKPKYDKDELIRIFDEIIFSGEYLEDVTIKGKLKVQFRTRTSEEVSEISRVIDATTYNLLSTMNEARMILNLQYALTSYQGRSLVGVSVEDKAKFIKRLPAPVIGAILDALYKFDDKVFEACKEIEGNF
jgi:hypothetical protein